MSDWIKRLCLARAFRVCPWRIPANVVRYISLRGPTKRDLERGEELAGIHGWH